jgi:hypothetical protein
VAAEHLDGMVGRLDPQFGEHALGDGRKEGQAALRKQALVLRRRVPGKIHLLLQVADECPATLGNGSLREQHASDIRMYDDRIGGLPGTGRARRRPQGQALVRVIARALVGNFRNADAQARRTNPGDIHEREHALQAGMWLPDDLATGPLEVQ